MMEQKRFEPSGPLLSRRQTLRLVKWSRKGKRMLTKLRKLEPPVKLLLSLLLLMLALSLMGCATQGTLPSELPRNPQPPQLTTDLPAESYLSRVESFLRKSREALTGM